MIRVLCIRCKKNKPLSDYYIYDGKPHENICKACKRAYAKQYRKDNWEQCKAAVRNWKHSNPEAYKKVRDRALIALRKARKNNRSKYNALEKQARDKLSNGYVRLLLTSHKTGLRASDIPDELLEVKREQVKLIRRIKQWQQ